MKQFLLIPLFFSFSHASFYGTILDKKTSQPIQNAIIIDKNKKTHSDNNGIFALESQQNQAFIKAYGYKALKLQPNNSKEDKHYLEPLNIKALYLTFWGASGKSKTMKRILDIIDSTDVNAIIVDVKNEYGSTMFKTSYEPANELGAYKSRTNRDIESFMKELKLRNIYTIARIVTFKDEIQASNNPDYAIKDEDGNIWRNHDEMAWVDPYDSRSHEYAIGIAKEAAKVGFDEINFDYIRFPAKIGLKFSKKHNQENRIKAIETFLSNAQSQLQQYGVYISVDIYGNVLWSNKCDNNIGQTIKSLSKHADYLAPMLYPSGFASGSFGKKNPSDFPYIVIYRSLQNIKEEIDLSRVRPWLQFFRDYAHAKRYYKKDEIHQQIQASEDSNTNGWMMWSPSSRYNQNYF